MSRLLVAWLLVAVAVPSPARAWSWREASHPTWSSPPRVWMHEAGSSDLGPVTSAAIVQHAFADWTNVSCTSLEVGYAGTTPSALRGGDGVSEVAWLEVWPYDPDQLGLTTSYVWSGRIVEADVALNASAARWSSAGSDVAAGIVDAPSIVLHEAGHFYGLGHSSISELMRAQYAGGVVGLGEDDVRGICTLYPGAATTQDCHRTGCPLGAECRRDGLCVVDRGICAPCDGDLDCPYGACLQYPDGRSSCGAACAASEDCAIGDVCFVVPGIGGQCVRVGASGPSCALTTGACRWDTECEPEESCDVARHACVPRSPGAELGVACVLPDDCASGLCVEGVCTETCDTSSSSAPCPLGLACDADERICVAPGASGHLGDPCFVGAECRSGQCVDSEHGPHCTRGCDDVRLGCPAGFACEAALGGGAVCVAIALPAATVGCSVGTYAHVPVFALACALACTCGVLRRVRRAGPPRAAPRA